MRPRTEIIEMFSSFIELEQDRFSKWFPDAKLRRSMQNCLDSSTELSTQENFWALYWHKRWQYTQNSRRGSLQSNSLPKMHIQAYLQEACYQVSRKIATLSTNSQYAMADFFQIANGEIETVFADFDPRRSSSLKAYFTMAIKSRLRDILRQRKEIDICSNWALLRKVSKKLFVESLNNAGLSAKQTSQYRLAWTCFKQLYIQTQPGGTASLPQPTPQSWQAIANLYNHSRHQLMMETPECNAQQIEEWLNRVVVNLRAYLFPPIKSLDTFKTDSDTDQSVDLPDPDSDSLIADIIATEDFKEQQNQISQMLGVLLKAFQALDKKTQEIIQLYYKEELTQQQMVQHLQISQSTVSRKLFKGRQFLLEALVKWSQELNISINHNQIKDMSIALEEWLKNQLGNLEINS